MRKSWNFISIMALALCMILCFSACGGPAGKIVKNTHATYYYEDIPAETGENEEDGEEGDSFSDNTKARLLSEIEKLKKKYPKEMPLFASDEESFAYTVVYPEKTSNQLSAAIKTFRSSLQRGLKADVTVATDSAAEKSMELLIGKTNRKLSSDLLQIIKSNRKNCVNDFLLYAKDGKIAIIADTDEATVKALNWFAETFCESQRTWTYLRDGYEFLYAPKYSLPDISVAGNTLFDYSAVTPKCGEYVYGRAVDDLIQTVRSKLHYQMDWEEERFSSSQKEILIGDLAKSESMSVTPGENEYILCAVGNKLVIKGYNSICLITE